MPPFSESWVPADTRTPVEELTIGEALRRAAALRPDHCALVEGIPDARARRRWTSMPLLADAEQVAYALLAGFRPGEQGAAFKTPRYWIELDAFPMTGSGKSQKFVLRERWQQGEAGSVLE
jgi:acyl-CoA synthetase (AMP-forming)/AMP-acid ligase II